MSLRNPDDPQRFRFLPALRRQITPVDTFVTHNQQITPLTQEFSLETRWFRWAWLRPFGIRVQEKDQVQTYLIMDWTRLRQFFLWGIVLTAFLTFVFTTKGKTK